MADCRNIQRNDAAAIARCGLSLKTIENSSVAKGKLNLEAKGAKTKDTYVEPMRSFPGSTTPATSGKKDFIKIDTSVQTGPLKAGKTVSKSQFEAMTIEGNIDGLSIKVKTRVKINNRPRTIEAERPAVEGRLFRSIDNPYVNANDRRAFEAMMAKRAQASGYPHLIRQGSDMLFVRTK